MKQVVLIDDSIRGGYQKVVTKELADVAQVWSPENNCRHTVEVLVNLHPWILQRQPDLVHINCGLHDLKTIVYSERDTIVPLEYYRHNIHQILRTILAHTKAKVIWATTTPINERNAHEAHAAVRDFGRYESDVVAYNRAALEVAAKLGVTVNDLYAVVEKAGRDRLLTTDGVHFTEEGSTLLGKAVAESIRQQLA